MSELDMAKVMQDLINLAKDLADKEASVKEKVAESTLEIQREYARSKIQAQDILNYAGANLAYNHGADMANKLNLDEKQKLGVQPFPASTSITINETVEQPQQTQKSKLLPTAALVGATLLSGGAGAAISPYLLSYFNKPEVKNEVEDTSGEVDLKVEGFNLE